MGLVSVFCVERRRRRSIPSSALSLGFLALAVGALFDGCKLGPALEGQRCVSSLEKEDEEVSGFWCLEFDLIGYLVVGLEGKKPKDFRLSLHNFKLYFLRILYSWSQALADSANMTFVDFVDNLMQGF